MKKKNSKKLKLKMTTLSSGDADHIVAAAMPASGYRSEVTCGGNGKPITIKA